MLRHQLALRAVQQWIDRTAEPIEVLTETGEMVNVAEASQAAIDSMKQHAQEQQTVNAVRAFVIRDFIPSVGLRAKEVLNAIIAEEQERLIDVPYALREAEKQRWIAEDWPYDKFEGGVSDAWRRWKADFNDEGPDSMGWGEKMRRMVANRGRAEKAYRGRLYARIFAMFEDTERYGPTWALCAVQQLRPGLATLKEQLLKEASDLSRLPISLGMFTSLMLLQGGKGPRYRHSLNSVLARSLTNWTKPSGA